mmetsp:Transcript_78614/g.206343  ORF Transcript_78614/g.206343 Transcript_78614/m.206343 type:complete len:264 (+) Transcript_78614:213-1004(+)
MTLGWHVFFQTCTTSGPCRLCAFTQVANFRHWSHWPVVLLPVLTLCCVDAKVAGLTGAGRRRGLRGGGACGLLSPSAGRSSSYSSITFTGFAGFAANSSEVLSRGSGPAMGLSGMTSPPWPGTLKSCAAWLECFGRRTCSRVGRCVGAGSGRASSYAGSSPGTSTVLVPSTAMRLEDSPSKGHILVAPCALPAAFALDAAEADTAPADEAFASGAPPASSSAHRRSTLVEGAVRDAIGSRPRVRRRFTTFDASAALLRKLAGP